jgi:post-segregation antitoxin (ccd killing protein)
MTESKRGGPREGAGRPRLEKDEQKRRNITLSDRLAEKARKIGGGNISEGIRKALDEYT